MCIDIHRRLKCKMWYLYIEDKCRKQPANTSNMQRKLSQSLCYDIICQSQSRHNHFISQQSAIQPVKFESACLGLAPGGAWNKPGDDCILLVAALQVPRFHRMGVSPGEHLAECWRLKRNFIFEGAAWFERYRVAVNLDVDGAAEGVKGHGCRESGTAGCLEDHVRFAEVEVGGINKSLGEIALGHLQVLASPTGEVNIQGSVGHVSENDCFCGSGVEWSWHCLLRKMDDVMLH